MGAAGAGVGIFWTFFLRSLTGGWCRGRADLFRKDMQIRKRARERRDSEALQLVAIGDGQH